MSNATVTEALRKTYRSFRALNLPATQWPKIVLTEEVGERLWLELCEAYGEKDSPDLRRKRFYGDANLFGMHISWPVGSTWEKAE